VWLQQGYFNCMPVTLPLDEMSTAEKLQIMEALWADLSRKPEQVPSPDWHGDVLAERERLIAEGKAKFSDWEEAKERIAARCNKNQGSR
jgi:hypothetical protein